MHAKSRLSCVWYGSSLTQGKCLHLKVIVRNRKFAIPKEVGEKIQENIRCELTIAARINAPSIEKPNLFVTIILVPSLIATAKNIITAVTHDTRATFVPRTLPVLTIPKNMTFHVDYDNVVLFWILWVDERNTFSTTNLNRFLEYETPEPGVRAQASFSHVLSMWTVRRIKKKVSICKVDALWKLADR